MIITSCNKFYLVKVLSNYIGDIDIFDIDNISNLFKDILFVVRNKYGLCGLFDIDVYVNDKYGMIMEINQIYEYDDMDVKIHFNLDSVFMCEIDDIDNYNYIYYYKDKFYTMYDDSIDSEVIYKDCYDIINNGIKIR